MRATLFRQEAVDFNRATLVGDALAARKLSFRLLTGFALAAVVALAALVWWGEYTRKAHVAGYLAPSAGVIKVYAGQAGALVEKHVSEGQKVQRGDMLFVVSTEQGSRATPEAKATAIATIRQRQANLEREYETQASIDRLQQRAMRERLVGMDAELGQLRSTATTQQQRVAGAERALARYESLAAQRFLADAQVEQKREELLEQRARLHELLRAQAALERDINSLRRELESADLKAANERSKIERDKAQLAQELTEHESRRTLVVTAPADGIATAVLGERGQTVGAQSVLLSILPADAVLEAKLLVPSRAIGFIAAGDQVSVRYQAFPYQRFGSFKGRVIAIPRTMTAPNEAETPVALNESVYRVTVALDDQRVRGARIDVALQAGMLLDADIWLERRRLVEWLFEPLFTVAGRV